MYSQTLVAPTLRVSSPLSPRSVPSICISPAADVSTHPDTPALEPSSPEDVLSPRSTYLLPPPVGSPLGRTHSQKTADKKGLDPSTFQELLAANRERAAKRSVSIADRLRREVVVKAHHNKQVERRALFLSRITAPPSPTSAETAVTPPETPAIFHFSLPSPGLASPLELFETVTSRERWIEQVDYKKPQRTPVRDVFPGRLPSLDQITARLRAKTAEVPAIPAIVVDAPEPVSVKPLTIVKGDRIDEVKPRSRLPASIIASTRARAASPPTPFPTEAAFAAIPVVSNTPSKLIISSSPPKSIKPVLVPQSIPALRINKTQAELAPVPVMSWRERPAAAAPTRPHMAESWRQEVPIKKEPARETVVTPITPRLVIQPPIGVKPAPPIPRETRPKVMSRRPEPLPIRPVAPTHTRTKSAEGVLKMDATGVVDGIAVSRRSAMLRVQKEVASALKLTESERRAVQGRNMVDKLRRRISAPAELQGAMKKGAPVGGF